MRVRLGTLIALVATACWPRAASAAASAHLVYVRGPGAETCPDEASIRSAVSARLGYDPFFPWAHDTIFVEVTGNRGAFRVELKLVDDQSFQRGTRAVTVKAGECAGVLESVRVRRVSDARDCRRARRAALHGVLPVARGTRGVRRGGPPHSRDAR